jgi:hypothetical protein
MEKKKLQELKMKYHQLIGNLLVPTATIDSAMSRMKNVNIKLTPLHYKTILH